MPFPMKETIAANQRRNFRNDAIPDLPLGRWLAGGATLAGASAAGTASAALVQIDLRGNVATVSGFNLDDRTNPDLTGDGFADLTSSRALTFRVPGSGDRIIGFVANYPVEAGFYLGSGSKPMFFATLSTSSTTGSSPTELRSFVLLSFSDSRINGGAPTSAALEVSMRNLSTTDHEARLLRVVFDDADPSAILCTCPKGEYPRWVDPSLTSKPKPDKNSARKRQLLRQIAALQRQIRSVGLGPTPKDRPYLSREDLDKVRKRKQLLRELATLRRQLAKL